MAFDPAELWNNRRMPQPLFVITGAAGAGKTTAGLMVAREETRVIVIDGDVIARGSTSAAVRDYDAYWHHVISIAEQIAANNVAPLIAGLCRPEQILANDLTGFSHLALVALTCSPEVRHSRAESRAGENEWNTPLEEHNEIDRTLRDYQIPPPHTMTIIDTSEITTHEVGRRVLNWLNSELSR